METHNKKKEDLIKDLADLQKAFDSLKELSEKEIKRLKLSEEKYLKIFGASPDSININRLSDGMYISINAGFTRILGYSEQEIIGKTSLEKNIWANPDDRTTLVNRLKKHGEVRDFEAEFLARDGKIITGLMSASIIEIEGVPHILNVTRDISKSKLDKEALEREKYLSDAFLNTLPDRIYFKDLESRFIRLSGYQAKLFGLNNPSEAIGKSDFDFFSKEHADQAYKNEQEIIRTGKPLIIEEKETFEDRPDIWVSTVKMPLYDNNGKIVGTFGISRDVTERKNAEDELAAERNLFRSLIDNMPDRIYFKDLHSSYIRINTFLAKLFGLHDPSEAVGKSDFDFFSKEHAGQAFNDEQEIIRTGKPLITEEKETFEDQPDIWVSTVKMPLYDNNGIIVGTFGISRDVTIRKKIEQELAAEKNLLRTLIDHLPDRVFTKDLENRFTMCNSSMLTRTGKADLDELLGKTDFDLMASSIAEKFFADEQEIIRTGKPIIDKEEFREDLNSSIAWSLTTKIPLRDSSGKITGIVGIGKDITERKRNEMISQVIYEIGQGITTTDNLDQLIKSIHQSLGKVVYAENCFIALHDQKTGLFHFPYFVDKFDQVPPPMAMEKSCTAYVLRNNKPFLFSQDSFDRLVKQNEVEQIGSYSPSWIGIPLRTPLKVIGVLVLQNYEKAGVYTENDERFLVSVSSQIALAIERKLSETDLVESEKALNESQKIAELGTYKLDFKTGKWSSSKILDSIFGIDEFYERSVEGWSKLIHPEWKQMMNEYLMNHVIENHRPFDKEYKIIRESDGQGRWVHGKGELSFDTNGNLISMIGTIMDITKSKIAEEEIRLKNELLQVINAEKDKFFSILAHDLRGPLSSFVAVTQIITEEIQSMTLEEIKDITMSMKNDASNIYSLLENLLEWSRLKRNVMEFVKEKFDLHEKIISCILPVSEMATKKNIKISTSVPEDLVINADIHMFETIIRNLVSNAIKFTRPYGKINIVALKNQDNDIQISINDSGIGMTDELKSKLFLLNEKTNRKGTEGEPSSGLGLLLCKEFIEKHNGRIWVESTEGKGSTFTFTIPS